jgi:hypothetical protein
MTGSYTVTVSAAGYNSKTSAAVSVTAPQAQQLSVSISGTPQVGSTLTAVVITNIPGEIYYLWYRNGKHTDRWNRLLADGSTYTVTAEDSGCSISVRVNANIGQPVTSAPVNIPFEYTNVSGRPSGTIALIFQELQEAYNGNYNGCKTAINTHDGPWGVTFTEDERDGRIVGGKLYIYFGLEYYDTLSSDKTTRLGQIGAELKTLAYGADLISW